MPSNPLSTPTRITLQPSFFDHKERQFLQRAKLAASLFRYDSGVEAIRLTSEQGEMVILPYLGQQIWSLTLAPSGMPARNLTFHSMFEQPVQTNQFLSTFGGFMQHCGLAGIGGPGPGESFPLHGELPTARYQQAWIEIGEDAGGEFIAVGGRYQHTVAFGDNYAFAPLVKLYARQPEIAVSFSIHNLRRAPMRFVYLAHPNFLPQDGCRLAYSAHYTPEHVRVRTELPSHVKIAPGYAELIEQIVRDPKVHHVLQPGQAYDPEVVFTIDYLADAQGWAHTMLIYPDGSAAFVRHQPAQLPMVARWICRIPDQDAIAIAELGTSRQTLAGGEHYRAEFVIGALNAEQAARYENEIERMRE